MLNTIKHPATFTRAGFILSWLAPTTVVDDAHNVRTENQKHFHLGETKLSGQRGRLAQTPVSEQWRVGEQRPPV